MATSAFKSTTKRPPITTSSPSTDDSPSSSSSSKPHRRSRSVSRFSRPIQSDIIPTTTNNFVNIDRGSNFPEISLDDLAIEFFSNGSELDDESLSNISSRRDRVKAEVTPKSQQRSRSVSRSRNGDGVDLSFQRRGRSVSRRNESNVTGSNARVGLNEDVRRRPSSSVGFVRDI